LKKPTDNLEAYEEYLRAKKLPWSQRIEPLLNAIKKDPDFSLAWVELASAYSKIPFRNQSEKPYYVGNPLMRH
jgi:Tfp pilus assembly protein PilF